MLFKSLSTALLWIPLTAIATASAQTPPDFDGQILKQRYDAFVKSLDNRLS